MIPFNKPPYTGNEDQYVLAAIHSTTMSGDGPFSKQCQNWFEKNFGTKKALMTPNCTQALEMAALLIDIQPGDEVIMPSFTFVSTANAFALRGARIKFIDVRSDTMNMDEELIEAAITSRTKAIVVVHYAGVSCEMDRVMQLADQYGLFVIEDAAQGVMSKYKGKALGTIGHLAAFSFHETKNYTSAGEGGLLLINDEQFIHRAEIIREKGTNRSQFFRGMVDKYSWVDLGSSYLPSEVQSAYLWGQLEVAESINNERKVLWNNYLSQLSVLAERGLIELPIVPDLCTHNAHMFYVKLADLTQRTKFLSFMKENGILAVFHYVPLHTSQAGPQFSEFVGEDRYTTSESERLVRLPLWYGLTGEQQKFIVDKIFEFFSAS